MIPFAETIDGAKKDVVSGTLDRVDWNAELVQGDVGKAVQQLKQESGEGLYVGGVTLPLALAELVLIDEYEFVVQPILAGHGPTLFAGLSERLELKLVGRQELGSGGGRSALPAQSSHSLKVGCPRAHRPGNSATTPRSHKRPSNAGLGQAFEEAESVVDRDIGPVDVTEHRRDPSGPAGYIDSRHATARPDAPRGRAQRGHQWFLRRTTVPR